jgi:hypothetical protein
MISSRGLRYEAISPCMAAHDTLSCPTSPSDRLDTSQRVKPFAAVCRREQKVLFNLIAAGGTKSYMCSLGCFCEDGGNLVHGLFVCNTRLVTSQIT